MISTLHFVLVLCVAASGASNLSQVQDCRAVPRAQSGPCADYFVVETWYGRPLDALERLDPDDSIAEFFDFFALLYQDNYCSRMLFTLLCFHYFPPCSPARPGVVATPCRHVCTEAMTACLPYAHALYGKMFESAFPQYLNCSHFAEVDADNISLECSVNASDESSTCSTIRELDEISSFACPNATIHIDFSPPIGSRTYQVVESAGYLNVCLFLANVGSYDHTATLPVPVTVKLSTKQTKTTFLPPAYYDQDYLEPVPRLTIPAGSVKGEKYCTEVVIIDDYLKEDRESFSVEATVLSPTNVNVGGNTAQSSTGSVEVIIIDDEEPVIPEEECKNKCSIRNRANLNTFVQNSYTYAAHIEALGQRDSNYSSLLDVIILECWELELNTCPHSNIKYSIPTCHGCALELSPGEEYLVAGRHTPNTLGRGLYLPNYRKGGLFAPWKRSYNSVNEWIQAASGMS